MNRSGETSPTLFSRLAYGLVGRQHAATVGRSPVPVSASQTSLIFELPNELILHILSFVSPEPQLTGHHARFRGQYCMQIDDDHQKRVRFLRPLSMTCKTMRSLLRPWIWDLIEPSRRRHYFYDSSDSLPRKLNVLMDALRADVSLGTNVKYLCILLHRWSGLTRILSRFMTVRYLWYEVVPTFFKCIKSLPNLHTLEIGMVNYFPRPGDFRGAIKRVTLLQIKSLILPPNAHPLVKHCPSVEDVDWVVRDCIMASNDFPRCLESIRGSKIKRLGIPLILPGDPSRFVAACPSLTELTVLYPHPHMHGWDPRGSSGTAKGLPPCSAERVRSAISDLVNECEALSDFTTLQIAHLTLTTLPPICWCGVTECGVLGPYTEEGKRAVREQMKGVVDWTMDCLKRTEGGCQEGEGEGKKNAVLWEQMNGVKGWVVDRLRQLAKMGYHKGEGRKCTTLRVIELSLVPTLPRPATHGRQTSHLHLGSVKVEEHEVWKVDSSTP